MSWLSLGLCMATGGAIVAYYEYEKERRLKEVRAGPSVGKAAIGGPFELVDAATGKPFTDKDLRGEYALLYFGFTMCPDICPDELVKMSEAIDLVEKSTGKRIQPVFLSVDPERDTVPAVKQYVEGFHPRLRGLTGTLEQTQAAARAYRVYYTKTDENDKDYLVDHSIIMYLLDAEGNFVTFYGKNHTAESLSESIAQHVSGKIPR